MHGYAVVHLMGYRSEPWLGMAQFVRDHDHVLTGDEVARERGVRATNDTESDAMVIWYPEPLNALRIGSHSEGSEILILAKCRIKRIDGMESATYPIQQVQGLTP